MKFRFPLFFAFVVLVGCQKGTTDTAAAPLAEQTLVNVSYGNDTAQRMDVYLPAGRTTAATKAVIMIHGGAWISGNKVDMNPYIPLIRSRLPDYAVFNIGYRLAGAGGGLTNVFPTQENDAKAAVAFITGKAGEYRFSTERMVILGASAGGHMALLQAYKNATPRFKAVADYFGPADMTALYNSYSGNTQLGLQLLMGGTPTTNATLYTSSSPINFISAQSPPTIILHGTADPVVPYSQSTALKTRLEAAGVAVKLVTYNGVGHGDDWSPATFADSYDQVINFFKEKNP